MAFQRVLDAFRNPSLHDLKKCQCCHNEPAVTARRMASGQIIRVGKTCRNSMGKEAKSGTVSSKDNYVPPTVSDTYPKTQGRGKPVKVKSQRMDLK